jgi:hypothetical protein
MALGVGEQREEWRGRYNVTLCSYCLMALRVAMKNGEFISFGLGVGALNGRIGVQQHCVVGLHDFNCGTNRTVPWIEEKKIKLGY